MELLQFIMNCSSLLIFSYTPVCLKLTAILLIRNAVYEQLRGSVTNELNWN